MEKLYPIYIDQSMNVRHIGELKRRMHMRDEEPDAREYLPGTAWRRAFARYSTLESIRMMQHGRKYLPDAVRRKASARRSTGVIIRPAQHGDCQSRAVFVEWGSNMRVEVTDG